jgi:hypothetical protein
VGRSSGNGVVRGRSAAGLGREVDCTIRDVLDPVVDAVGANGAAD